MKIALVSGYKDSAIDQVMKPLQKGLEDRGVKADLITVYDYYYDKSADKTFSTYDLVHYGYFRYAKMFEGYVAIPSTANIWHIPIGKEMEYGEDIIRYGLDRLITDDVMTLQQLGRIGLMNVTPIPILFDQTKFSPLPIPNEDFTVGIFCNNYNYKRWEVIIEACSELKIPCHAMILEDTRKVYDLNPIEDVYSLCHVMVHATFVDTNSLPLREALLCGRPVITTHNDGIHQVVKEGVNGLYFDGTKGDLQRAILQVKANYDTLRAGALATQMPSADMIVDRYLAMFQKVLSESQGD